MAYCNARLVPVVNTTSAMRNGYSIYKKQVQLDRYQSISLYSTLSSVSVNEHSAVENNIVMFITDNLF